MSVGDAGIVEPSGKTQRMGIDFSIRYQLQPWLFADADITPANPKAKGVEEVEDNIPLTPGFSSIGGLTAHGKNGWNGSLRYRYLNDRPANEDNSLVADGYCLMDGVLNYTKQKFEVGISLENILNADWQRSSIRYGIEDVHRNNSCF